jgi:hypothetical protein
MFSVFQNIILSSAQRKLSEYRWKQFRDLFSYINLHTQGSRELWFIRKLFKTALARKQPDGYVLPAEILYLTPAST